MLHTDIPTRDDLALLFKAREAGSVSIYVPTTPVTPNADEGRIELKNLAYEALTRLRESGLHKRDVSAIEEEFASLDEDGDFWAQQAHSLAIFATPAHLTTFRIPNRIGAFVQVSDRFYLKPLLRAVTFPQAAFVLALAQGSVRLIEVSADQPPNDVAVPAMPADIASAAGKSSIKDRSESGRFQGSEGQKVRMAHYSRQIDTAIRPILKGHDIPLILAATEPLDSVYRSINTYAHLAETTISGNPETSSDGELAAEARIILDAWYAAELANVRERFELLMAQDRASTDIAYVARAATFGAIDTLLVDIDDFVPGTIDEDSGAVTFASGDGTDQYGVVDEVARRAFLTGARILAVRREDIPGNATLAALLRYRI